SHFELFMDENNQKISKSKGNGLSMEEWLRYGTPQSLAYYMYQSPKSAKRLYFDVIPKATDEYLSHLDAFNRAAAATNAPAIDNPAWHVHTGAAPTPRRSRTRCSRSARPPASSRCARGSARSTRCCWASPPGPASAPSSPSSASSAPWPSSSGRWRESLRRLRRHLLHLVMAALL